MSFHIVADSCCELTADMKKRGNIEIAPLTLEVGGESILDDETFDQKSFLRKVAECPECPKSACPSPEYFRTAFLNGAKHCYAVTLSAQLSGSYNSAVLGANLAQEEDEDLKIHVFNSRSASIGETLIVKKIVECEEAGMSFERVVETVELYISTQHTYFVLENLETLRKNGRLSKTKALVASALKIKPVMGATSEGDIVQLDQARGINKACALLRKFVPKWPLGLSPPGLVCNTVTIWLSSSLVISMNIVASFALSELSFTSRIRSAAPSTTTKEG